MLVASKATWKEIKSFVNKKTVAVLPVGALEQHGPHLPLSTDTIMATGLAYRIVDELNGLLLPEIAYGETWNNTGFPGTLSLSFATMKAIIEDICYGLKENGLKSLIIVNGHFGNKGPIDLAARKMGTENFPVLVLNYPGLEALAEKYCDSQPAAPSFYHADEVETSIMLALDPEVVHMDKAVAEYPEFPKTWGSEIMRLDKFNKSGVFGDPRPATPEKGVSILDGLVIECMSIISAFLK
jgi:creatinine amidohydrolase